RERLITGIFSSFLDAAISPSGSRHGFLIGLVPPIEPILIANYQGNGLRPRNFDNLSRNPIL
ncbi:MAG: hypothetical protein AAF942_05010, partial [Pseudomonadota bacterium]